MIRAARSLIWKAQDIWWSIQSWLLPAPEGEALGTILAEALRARPAPPARPVATLGGTLLALGHDLPDGLVTTILPELRPYVASAIFPGFEILPPLPNDLYFLAAQFCDDVAARYPTLNRSDVWGVLETVPNGMLAMLGTPEGWGVLSEYVTGGNAPSVTPQIH